MSSCKVPLFLSDFNETWILPTDFQKKKKHSNIKFSWKFVEWENHKKNGHAAQVRET